MIGGNSLLPNFFKMAGNVQTPFYWIDTDSLMILYINFHRPICNKDFLTFWLLEGQAMCKTNANLVHGPISVTFGGRASPCPPNVHLWAPAHSCSCAYLHIHVSINAYMKYTFHSCSSPAVHGWVVSLAAAYVRIVRSRPAAATPITVVAAHCVWLGAILWLTILLL